MAVLYSFSFWATLLAFDSDPAGMRYLPATNPTSQQGTNDTITSSSPENEATLREKLKSAGDVTKQQFLLVAGIATSILSVATTILALRKTIYLPAMETIKKVQATLGTLKKLDEMWSPNGGGSYADAVMQIRDELFVMKAHNQIVQRHLNISTFELDEFGNLEEANKSFLQLVKASESDLNDNGWTGFITEHDRTRVINLIKSALQYKIDFQFDTSLLDGEGRALGDFRMRGFKRMLGPETLAGFVISVDRIERPHPPTKITKELGRDEVFKKKP